MAAIMDTYGYPLPNVNDWRQNIQKERKFVNDAIRTHNYCSPRKLSMIPRYDPRTDQNCRTYFESDLVDQVLKRTLQEQHLGETKKSQDLRKSQEKSREGNFINDAVVTETKRTRLNDTLMPNYSAIDDPYCRDYFSRKDVKKVLKETYSERPAMAVTFRTEPSYGKHPSPIYLKALAEQKRHGKDRISSAQRSYSPTRGSRHIGSATSSASQETTASYLSVRREKTYDAILRKSGVITDPPRSKSAASHLTYDDINSLGYRHIAKPAVSQSMAREKESRFVNDAILTERKRTRFHDVIPHYDSMDDRHCRAYFSRPDIKRLTGVTRTLKPVINIYNVTEIPLSIWR